jgi:hypothetical protein
MKHIIEYQPQISKECQTYISNNINPVYTGEDTDIYYLDYVIESLQIAKEEKIFDISVTDIKQLTKLLNEQVDYIEF